MNQTDLQLEVARGVSAITVLITYRLQAYAFRFFGEKHWTVDLFAIAARHAVIVFFLLSGHLITKSMSKIKKNLATSN